MPDAPNLAGGSGSGASAQAVLNPTSVASLTLSSGGSGYTSGVTVTLVGGGGTGATASATVANGVVTGLVFGSGGGGYTSAPSVVFTPTTPSVGGGAYATANLNTTWLSGIVVTKRLRNGYTALPTVTVGGATVLPPPLGATVTTGEVKDGAGGPDGGLSGRLADGRQGWGRA